MFAFIPPFPPSKTAEKEDKLDTWFRVAKSAGAREIIGYIKGVRMGQEKPRHNSRARPSVVLTFRLDDRPQRVYTAALLDILVMYGHLIHHHSTHVTSPPSSAYLPDHSMV
ncbi:hypothetical protein CVT25_003358 [Psilocybe cyanescens]|uniref:Uncharacterized protein n=1 Tax=Psilocybe cyanescens TaxID=93625 RepID=A0A409XQM4_PSICY|nr:hypothetical protein CVT25_003358 [Psilocybe cyanescens]